MSDEKKQRAGQPPVHKENEHGIHTAVYRKMGKYGPFYETTSYKPYQDQQTSDWKKGYTFLDRDMPFLREQQASAMKAIREFKQLDKEVAARYKQEYNGQHPQQQQSQPAQSQSKELDHNAMQRAQQEAYGGAPEQPAAHMQDRPHEPSR